MQVKGYPELREWPRGTGLIVFGTAIAFLSGFCMIVLAVWQSFTNPQKALVLFILGLGLIVLGYINRLLFKIRLNRLAGRRWNA